MTQKTKETIKRYVHSSVITFLAGFIPALAVLVQNTSFAEIEKAGLVGGTLVLLRLVVKAGYEGLTVLLVWAAAKMKSLRK
jgi:hypothetical protein